MKILIRKARILDPSSPFHRSIKDIYFKDGIIHLIDDNLRVEADSAIEIENLHVSPGWVDVFANFNDPGFEFKETLETGANAAASGGFTHVMVIPNTRPSIDNKSQVEYIKAKSNAFAATIHPIGAVTRNTEGKELAEMYDMYASGATAFSDGVLPLQSSGMVLKALLYVKAFGGVVIQIPDDNTIGSYGLINEGIVSTKLGLPGKPAMSEELMVARDIKLARYTNSKIHFTGISSTKSIEYIQRAKQGGLQVTCSVTPYHLSFVDEDLAQYDTNLKVFPPLRSNKDKQGLLKAIEDGTVDCVATHHQPHEWDSKSCEFEYAKPGMIGLETCYGVLGSVGVSTEKFIELASINPRRIFGLPNHGVNKDVKADVTMFVPGERFIFHENQIRSKSKNSAFIGKELRGKVIGIINGEKLFLNP